MRSRRKYIYISAALAVLAGLVGMGIWVLTTPQGVHFLFRAVSALSPLEIHAQKVTGKVLGELKIEGLKVRWPQGEIGCDLLGLHLTHWEWSRPRIILNRLAVKGVHIRDDRPPSEKPPDLSLPEIPFWLGWLQGRIETARIEEVTYRRAGKDPQVVVERASGNLEWTGGVFTAGGIQWVSPLGQAEGEGFLSLARPELRLDFRIRPARPVARFDFLHLDLHLLPAKKPEVASGPVRLTGRQREGELFRLEGRMALSPPSIRLTDLLLSQHGRRGTVRAEGEAVFGPQTRFSLRVLLAGLDLGPEIKSATDISGEVDLEGTVEQYQCRFQLANRGKGWQDIRLSGGFQGNGAGIEAEPIGAQLLGGSLAGRVEVSWAEQVSLLGHLRGEGFNPDGILPAWEGRINTEMTGDLRWTGGSFPEGTLRVQILDSTLRERSLSGELELTLKSDTRHAFRFALRLDPGEMRGALSGALKEGAWDGTLERLEGREPSGAWALQAPVRLQISSGHLKTSPLVLASEGGEEIRAAANFLFDPLRGSLEGKWRNLNLARADLWLKRQKLQGRTSGSLTARGEKDGWRISSTLDLTGTFRQDSFQIQVPSARARLNWDSKGLQGTLAAEIERNGRLQGKVSSPDSPRPSLPGRGRAEAAWKGIDLELIRTFFPASLDLKGNVSGKAEGQWLPDQRVQASLDADLSNGRLRWQAEDRKIESSLEDAGIHLSWRDQRLEGKARLASKEYGWLKGTFSLPVTAGPVPQMSPKGDMEISVQGKFLDQGLAASLFPDVVGKSGGRFDLDLLGQGTWENPRVGGTVAVSQVQVHLLPGGKGRAGREGRDGEAFSPEPLKLQIASGVIRGKGDSAGLRSSFSLRMEEEGSIRGNLSSSEAFGWKAPQEASLEAFWEALDLELIRPFLPASIRFGGRASGEVRGRWFPGSRFRFAGGGGVPRGTLKWKGAGKDFEAAVESLEASFSWQEEEIRAKASVLLSGLGRFRGEAAIPLAAQLPLAIRSSGPVAIRLEGNIQDKGLLAALLPDVVEESWGKADLELNAGGVWQQPEIKGDLQLQGAGVHLRVRAKDRKEKISRPPPAPQAIKLRVDSARLKGEWGQKGLQVDLSVDLDGGGSVRGKMSSPEPSGMTFPRKGLLEAEGKAVDLGLFHPLVPEGLKVEGLASMEARGQWLPGWRLDTSGSVKVYSAALGWQGKDGSVNAGVEEASLSFVWRGETLEGQAALALAQYGRLRGQFRLPLPARLPPTVDSGAPLRVSLKGRFQEKGLITAVFPGLIQESSGQVEIDLAVDGTWQEPVGKGNISLSKAGAFVPSLGTRIEDLSAQGVLRGNELQIVSFRAKSGAGFLEGKGDLQFKGWQVSGYSGNLRGERFQALYLPDLRISASPSLTFQGTRERLTLRGEIRLPEVFIYGRPEEVIRPSEDVVIVDEPPRAPFPLALDVRVRLILGKRVLVKALGIDARLEGGVEVRVQGLERDRITARGEIHVAEGHYSSYGVRLRITRGRVLFADGPMDRPALDILALRQAGDIQAGVAITGDTRKPLANLYSRPSMPDTDILSYIVLGRPLNRAGAEADLLLAAAGALLSRAESVTLQYKVKSYLGLDTVDIQAGAGDVTRSMVTIGKYLSPDLYISLGQGLFSNTTLLTLRYSLTERQKWEISSRTGDRSGVDLYYRIDFY